MSESEFAEIRQQLGRIEALLVMLSGRLAANPVELVEGMGRALAAAQGYDRPLTPQDAPSRFEIATPGIRLYEPANEAQERQAAGGWETPDESWWETMEARTGMPVPPGELDGEGP